MFDAEKSMNLKSALPDNVLNKKNEVKSNTSFKKGDRVVLQLEMEVVDVFNEQKAVWLDASNTEINLFNYGGKGPLLTANFSDIKKV